jgi:hypothetical protein
MRRLITEPRRPFKFAISSKDVNKAVRNDPCLCVIALACMRQFPGLLEIRVHRSITYLFYSGGKCERYTTPYILSQALRRWDAGGDWELPEGEYKLTPISYSQRLSQAPRNLISNGVRTVERYLAKGFTKTEAMDKVKASPLMLQRISDAVGIVRKVKGAYVTTHRVLNPNLIYHTGRKVRRSITNPRLINLRAIQAMARAS